jgi:hypothetical protein
MREAYVIYLDFFKRAITPITGSAPTVDLFVRSDKISRDEIK